MRRPLLILVSGLVVAAVVLAWRGTPGWTTSDVLALPREDYTPLPLSSSIGLPSGTAPAERVLRAVRLRAVRLDPAAADSLFRATVTVLHDGEVYVLDFGDTRVKRFDRDGRFLNAIGSGQGNGPGELDGMSGLAVRGDTVWVNGGQRSMAVFLRDGTFVDRYAVAYFPGSLAATESGLFSVALGHGGDGLLARIGARGEIEASFGVFTEGQATHAISIANGDLVAGAPATRGGVLFLPDAASYAFAFTPDGSLARYVVTVGRRGFPPPDRTPEGATRYPSPEVYTLTGTVSDGKLYVNAHIKGQRDEATGEVTRSHRSLLDVYDATTLAYEYSIEIPPQAAYARVVGNRVYAIEEQTRLVAYEIEGL